jgi:sugar phosphate isomerase/epimerase
MDRRKFIQQSAMLGTGIAVAPTQLLSSFEAKKLKKVGVQLYTLRKAISKDPEAILGKVAGIGYNFVEFFGYNDGKYFGKTAKEIRQYLDNFGIQSLSSHYQTGATTPNVIGTLTNNWEKAVADSALLGQKYCILAYLNEPERKTIDDYKRTADLLNKCGEVTKKYGIQMGYHNHAFEFDAIDGQVPMDVLLNNTDANLVKMESDLYWIVKAGMDPVEFFKKHAGRIELWHVKDMDNTPQKAFAEVGSGTINWAKIFAAQKISGMKHFFVEQDDCKDRDPLDSITMSYKYLKGLKY